MQSILAVGYEHRVDILCQQRMTYFADDPGWGLCRTIDISGSESLLALCEDIFTYFYWPTVLLHIRSATQSG